MFRPNWTALGGDESTPFPLLVFAWNAWIRTQLWGPRERCVPMGSAHKRHLSWNMFAYGVPWCSALQSVWNNRKKNRSRMWCPHEILEFKHNFGFHLKVVSPWCSAREWVTWRDRGVSMRLGDSLRPWVTERGHQVYWRSGGRMYTRNKGRMYTRTTCGRWSHVHAGKFATTRE